MNNPYMGSEISPTARTLDLLREEWTRDLKAENRRLREALKTIADEADQRWVAAFAREALEPGDE